MLLILYNCASLFNRGIRVLMIYMVVDRTSVGADYTPKTPPREVSIRSTELYRFNYFPPLFMKAFVQII